MFSNDVNLSSNVNATSTAVEGPFDVIKLSSTTISSFETTTPLFFSDCLYSA